jgi:hypothetical protein
VAAVVVAGAVAAVVGDAERDEEDVVMHASMRTGCTAIVIGLLVCLAQAASAQGDLPKSFISRLDPAWDRLAQSNAKFLNLDQQALLDDLAFAAAVSGGCPGFQLDKPKFEEGFKSFKTDDYMKMPPDEKRRREYRLMANYGATVALYTAEGLLHPKGACKFAETKRDTGPGRFWLPVSDTPPAK